MALKVLTTSSVWNVMFISFDASTSVLSPGNLVDFFRRQGWLAYAPASSQATDATPSPPRGPGADLTPSQAMQTSVPPPPARQLTSTSPDARQDELTAATPPAAGAKDTSRKPRRAAKATPEDNAAVSQSHTSSRQAKGDGSECEFKATTQWYVYS
ncbi:unnamed protein product [Phytophthora fragariaefolia]|uniref:Unnamed protein product n=1 Tax=Phytophthora fragariaefolia TaxID=1490495 RepID=A0A9W6Y2Y8_9STRA|nr:unnamed protein product [Phytophthora fragariaefolia]